MEKYEVEYEIGTGALSLKYLTFEAYSEEEFYEEKETNEDFAYDYEGDNFEDYLNQLATSEVRTITRRKYGKYMMNTAAVRGVYKTEE